MLDGLPPLHDRLLCVSGRLSFELVRKAAVAGAPILVGVGAPTSLAVELAADRGMTLCGFARRGAVNVFRAPSGSDRAYLGSPTRASWATPTDACGPRAPYNRSPSLLSTR